MFFVSSSLTSPSFLPREKSVDSSLSLATGLLPAGEIWEALEVLEIQLRLLLLLYSRSPFYEVREAGALSTWTFFQPTSVSLWAMAGTPQVSSFFLLLFLSRESARLSSRAPRMISSSSSARPRLLFPFLT